MMSKIFSHDNCVKIDVYLLVHFSSFEGNTRNARVNWRAQRATTTQLMLPDKQQLLLFSC